MLTTPFNYRDTDGSFKGFDVDIALALCEHIQRKCEVVGQDWDGMIPALLAKKFDLIAASMSITEERQKKIDFTRKYWAAVSKFIGKRDTTIDLSKPDLGGARIGVQRGTVQSCYVTKHYPDAQVSLYPRLEDGFSDMKAGRIDAFASESVQMQREILDQPDGKDYAFVSPALDDLECFGPGIGIALRKGNEELRDQLSDAIVAIRKDGTYKKINDKYFGFDLYGPE
ncbi:transporter substrate-binding domain-containing protein [Rhizobium beringeri]